MIQILSVKVERCHICGLVSDTEGTAEHLHKEHHYLAIEHDSAGWYRHTDIDSEVK